ncbi:MAG: type II toxin-antitoxin system VapC family toxin [Acidimicrobiia bacterium]
MLADTSVWIDHLQRGNPELARLLQNGGVSVHPFVIGELACGRLRRRQEILTLLTALPQLGVLAQEEALAFLEGNRLMGTGLGWIDIHLLGSVMLARTRLWTLDRSLRRAADGLGIAAEF